MESMRYTETECIGFVLEFRDGRSIAFKVEKNEEERNEWMDVLEESHYLLSSNPMPPWV